MMLDTTESDRIERFERALGILRDENAAFTADMVYALSDLDGDQLAAFQAAWAAMPSQRRRDLIVRLVDVGETNFELDFSAIINPALDDAETDVRAVALEGVLEDSPLRVIERVMAMAQDEPFSEVRAKAASAMGQFILLGELGQLPEWLSLRLQDIALKLHHNIGEDLDVRRRALEAVANCGRDEVPELIREAYYADDLLMRVSAVFAMGRTCDEVWEPQVIDELGSEYPEMRYEAARASGELELNRAVPRLIQLAYDDDREIRAMAIWALGEIGGQRAERALTELAAVAESADDDDLSEAIAEAQAVAMLAGDDVLGSLADLDEAMPLFEFGDYEDHMHEDDEDDELLGLDDFDDEDFD